MCIFGVLLLAFAHAKPRAQREQEKNMRSEKKVNGESSQDRKLKKFCFCIGTFIAQNNKSNVIRHFKCAHVGVHHSFGFEFFSFKCSLWIFATLFSCWATTILAEQRSGCCFTFIHLFDLLLLLRLTRNIFFLSCLFLVLCAPDFFCSRYLQFIWFSFTRLLCCLLPLHQKYKYSQTHCTTITTKRNLSIFCSRATSICWYSGNLCQSNANRFTSKYFSKW